MCRVTGLRPGTKTVEGVVLEFVPFVCVQGVRMESLCLRHL